MPPTDTNSGALPAAKAIDLANLVDYQDGSIVSRTLAGHEAATITLFAFATGQSLSEHTAPFDALVHILDGAAELTIGGDPILATTGQAVLGKFFAGWAFMIIALVLTLPILFTIAYLGDPEIGPVFTGYLGACLLAGACLAVSSFFSVITKSQVISCVLAVIACVLFILIGNPSIQPMLPDAISNLFTSLSFATHFDVMQRGIIEVQNLVFMAVITVGFVLASIVMLDDRKAA